MHHEGRFGTKTALEVMTNSKHTFCDWIFSQPFVIRTSMNTRLKAAPSPLQTSIGFGLYTAVLFGLMIAPLSGQFDAQDGWRRTSRGWEHAHAVQQNSKTTMVPDHFDGSSTIEESAFVKAHRIALPIAIGSFFVSFGCWLLIGVPNRAIIRRISQSD
jgi:hypothetical protein